MLKLGYDIASECAEGHILVLGHPLIGMFARLLHSLGFISVPDELAWRRTILEHLCAFDDHVWIGNGTSVTKGVHIEKNSVIGMRAVVSRDIPANSIAAGAPAKVIKENIRRDDIAIRYGGDEFLI